MQAVVEVPAFDDELPPPWPVAPMPAWSSLMLAADCTDQQLGFLAALDAWTTRIGLGRSGSAIVDAVDRNFAMTTPLKLPAG